MLWVACCKSAVDQIKHYIKVCVHQVQRDKIYRLPLNKFLTQKGFKNDATYGFPVIWELHTLDFWNWPLNCKIDIQRKKKFWPRIQRCCCCCCCCCWCCWCCCCVKIHSFNNFNNNSLSDNLLICRLSIQIVQIFQIVNFGLTEQILKGSQISRKFTLCLQVILYGRGLAFTLHSKYTSSPSLMLEAFRLEPSVRVELGTSKKKLIDFLL